MKKLPAGRELEATGMTRDRRKELSRRAGGPSAACEKGTGKASPLGAPLQALLPAFWVTLGMSLHLSGPLSLPSQPSVGSGSVCPSSLCSCEVWLCQLFLSNPGERQGGCCGPRRLGGSSKRFEH